MLSSRLTLLALALSSTLSLAHDVNSKPRHLEQFGGGTAQRMVVKRQLLGGIVGENSATGTAAETPTT